MPSSKLFVQPISLCEKLGPVHLCRSASGSAVPTPCFVCTLLPQVVSLIVIPELLDGPPFGCIGDMEVQSDPRRAAPTPDKRLEVRCQASLTLTPRICRTYDAGSLPGRTMICSRVAFQLKGMMASRRPHDRTMNIGSLVQDTARTPRGCRSDVVAQDLGKTPNIGGAKIQ